MDILQPLPVEKWSLLRDSLKRDWPTYSIYYYWVNNAIKWKRKDPQLKHEIFCPNGSHESGTFVGIHSISLYIIVVFTFEECKNLFRRIFEETKVIDWSKKIYFAAVHQHFKNDLVDVVNKMSHTKNIEIATENVTYHYFKSKEECAKITVQVPEECEVKYLEPSHIPLIHSLWPHREVDRPDLSTKFLTILVTLNRGVGLFLKKDNSLVSWVLHSDWGGLGMLQTVEEHKRKGYAKVVVKAMIKELAETENLDSILTVIENNIPSENFFKSLDYNRLMKATWVIVRPVTD